MRKKFKTLKELLEFMKNLKGYVVQAYYNKVTVYLRDTTPQEFIEHIPEGWGYQKEDLWKVVIRRGKEWIVLEVEKNGE